MQLVIYGISGAIVAEQVLPFDPTFFTYLEYVLRPGGAEVPAQLVVDAVAAGQTASVAAVFAQALDAGYYQQLTAILKAVMPLSPGCTQYVCFC